MNIPHDNNNDPTQQQSTYKPSKKAFFFGTNKKKKQKPVCTCHLAYGVGPVPMNSAVTTSGGFDTAAYSSSSITLSPHHQQLATFYGSQPMIQLEPNDSSYQTMSYFHVDNNQMLPHYFNHQTHRQLIEDQVPKQISNPTLYNRNYIQSAAMTTSNSFLLRQPENRQYRHQQNSCAIDPIQTSNYSSQVSSATYSPDFNLHRRQQQKQSQINSMENQRQRRWSDGNAFLSQIDQEYLRQQEQEQQSLYISPPPKDFACQCNQCVAAMANNNYINDCYGKPTKPRVSFGPSMMYPFSSSDDPYNQTEKNKKKSPKLTTELLPLDTQIPLQMMGDSALICKIL